MTDTATALGGDDPDALTHAVIEREGIGDLPIDEQIAHLRNRVTDARAEVEALARAAHRLTVQRNHRLAAPNLREHRRP
ncbi:hypothetical protein [Pseudonocardia sp. NPDC049635]|uniref:hypothetical protein n=1 Tax=Pseudonocardia sp. NPDC049635 TaxID=3155506 RepID=UPI0033FEB758